MDMLNQDVVDPIIMFNNLVVTKQLLAKVFKLSTTLKGKISIKPKHFSERVKKDQIKVPKVSNSRRKCTNQMSF